MTGLGLTLKDDWRAQKFKTKPEANFPDDLRVRLEKVKLARLTRQRHAWEQGVASQTLLELGEKEPVIMMAWEALLRQWEDGWLAQS